MCDAWEAAKVSTWPGSTLLCQLCPEVNDMVSSTAADAPPGSDDA
jgi:hypothetical protein